MGYSWAGYHSDPKMKDAPAVNVKEQPADKGKPVTSGTGTPNTGVVLPAAVAPKGSVPPMVRPGTGETQPPPLAEPMPRPAPAPALAPRPLPTGPALPVAPTPVLPPLPTPVPAKPSTAPLPPIPLPSVDGGPSLNGPGE